MIGLDTNLLVRLLVEDDEAQTELASRLLAQCHQEGTRCLVTMIVLCELEWVLTACYKAPRSEIGAAVEGLLTDELFVVERPDLVGEALGSYRQGKGDLSDYLLGIVGRDLGAGTTYTFDRELRHQAGFTLLTG